jgi:hypothetical protein
MEHSQKVDHAHLIAFGLRPTCALESRDEELPQQAAAFAQELAPQPRQAASGEVALACLAAGPAGCCSVPQIKLRGHFPGRPRVITV